MIPTVAEWLGVTPVLVPGYAAMVAIASLVAAPIILGQAKREGVELRGEARTLLLAYLGALVGGYVYEWIRVTPEALITWSVEPFLHVGRAAYGGLLFALGAAYLYQRRLGAPPLRFFDRAALGMGPIYAFVRTGCFLEGCDYGAVTASALGVRYPAGSLAAGAHAQAGWVPLGMESLPVHATQLYEGAGALVASALAWVVLRRTRAGAAPVGAAFCTWLMLYALLRATVELVRDDAWRGIYGGLSTAQWTSLGVGLAAASLLASAWWRMRRSSSAEAAVGA